MRTPTRNHEHGLATKHLLAHVCWYEACFFLLTNAQAAVLQENTNPHLCVSSSTLGPAFTHLPPCPKQGPCQSWNIPPRTKQGGNATQAPTRHSELTIFVPMLQTAPSSVTTAVWNAPGAPLLQPPDDDMTTREPLKAPAPAPPTRDGTSLCSLVPVPRAPSSPFPNVYNSPSSVVAAVKSEKQRTSQTHREAAMTTGCAHKSCG